MPVVLPVRAEMEKLAWSWFDKRTHTHTHDRRKLHIGKRKVYKFDHYLMASAWVDCTFVAMQRCLHVCTLSVQIEFKLEIFCAQAGWDETVSSARARKIEFHSSGPVGIRLTKWNKFCLRNKNSMK